MSHTRENSIMLFSEWVKRERDLYEYLFEAAEKGLDSSSILKGDINRLLQGGTGIYSHTSYEGEGKV